MSTQIGDLIFESGKTLFEILDALDVPQVSSQLDAVNVRIDEVNDQLRQLGAIVDTNQANSNASFIAVNTRLDDLNTEVIALNLAVAPLSIQVTNLEQEVATLSAAVLPLETLVSDLENQVIALTANVTHLTNLVSSYESRITSLESRVTNLSLQVDTLAARIFTVELDAPRSQQLHLGNQYIFSYRTGGVPGTTFFYRITYSGPTTTRILAATGYSANVLSSQEGTSTERTVWLAAPFDLFSVSGRFNYPMIQGPCRLSFTVNNTNPIDGYITMP
jgi:uncharacterized coiled-coil protein SlyX